MQTKLAIDVTQLYMHQEDLSMIGHKLSQVVKQLDSLPIAVSYYYVHFSNVDFSYSTLMGPQWVHTHVAEALICVSAGTSIVRFHNSDWTITVRSVIPNELITLAQAEHNSAL